MVKSNKPSSLSREGCHPVGKGKTPEPVSENWLNHQAQWVMNREMKSSWKSVTSGDWGWS